jgi:tetratricopeptide (TPR) repeat protein
VREHFKQQLKRDRPDAWREANNRLYEYLKSTAKEFPETVEEMSPLFAAVLHGCAAGRHEEAFDEVFQRRIQREYPPFSINKLGAFGANLAALSGFFEIPWRQPVMELGEGNKGFVLNAAGYCLRALGRLQEATQPLRTALEGAIARENWGNASAAANNLSSLYLTIGNPREALKLAQQDVELADRSEKEFDQMIARIRLADALYQMGQTEDAAGVFVAAEKMQKQRQPEYPILYALQGFLYCALLLDQGKMQEVKERAARTLDWFQHKYPLLDIALDNLSLGRAWLLEAQRAGTNAPTQAEEFLQRAVGWLRQSGRTDYLPRGLLSRAELYRAKSEYQQAKRDLAEVWRIATRGGMGLYLADYHLESARLRLAQGEREKAREHWETAKEMIERMGYHRRDKEVEEIAGQLG